MKRSLIIIATLFAAGCDDGKLDRQIKIVLPNDYAGEIRIVKDSSGTPFQASPDYYTFIVPGSGELHTPDLSPFFRWHNTRFEFADGRVIEDVKSGVVKGQGLSIDSSTYDGTTMRWAVRRAS